MLQHRRWTLLAVCAAVIASLFLSTVIGSAIADDLKERKHEAERKIKASKQDVQESSAALRDATAALDSAKSQLVTARSELATSRAQLQAAVLLDEQMQRRLAQAQERLRQARVGVAQGEQEVEDQALLLRQMVVSNYQSGDPGLMGLSTVLTSKDPAALTGHLKSAQTVLDKESGVLDRLAATKALLTVHQREVNAAKLEVAERRKEAADNLAQRRTLEASAEAAEQRVSELVTKRAGARKQAQKAREDDLKQLKEAEAERARIEQMIRDRASRGKGYNGPTTGNGWLDWPAPGRITSPYGWRIHPIYGYRSLHDGIDIGAACGTPLKAAQSGTVLSEYSHSVWGNRLIMDHGVKYGVGVATIYNHMSGYAVGVGEKVKKGQTIGYVGSTGWSTGCHLHFSVLENGSTVNPTKWL